MPHTIGIVTMYGVMDNNIDNMLLPTGAPLGPTSFGGKHKYKA